MENQTSEYVSKELSRAWQSVLVTTGLVRLVTRILNWVADRIVKE